MFEGVNELLMKGAIMAIGGGVGTAIILILGWNVVQFVLAKYGKKKNGNGKAAPAIANALVSRAITLDDCNGCKDAHAEVIRTEFALFRKEFKEELRDERELFKEQLHAEHMFISDVNKRAWDHVQDRAAHAGGR